MNKKVNIVFFILVLSVFMVNYAEAQCPGCCALSFLASGRTRCVCPSVCTCFSEMSCRCPPNCGCGPNGCVG